MLKNTVGRQCNGEDFNCGKCAPRNAMASRCVLVLILNLLLATSGFAKLSQLTQIQRNRQLVEHYLDSKQYDSAAIFGKRIINDKTYTNATDFLKFASIMIFKKDTGAFYQNVKNAVLLGADSAMVRLYLRKISPDDSKLLTNYLKTNYWVDYYAFRKRIDTSRLAYMDKIADLDQLVRKSFKLDTNISYIVHIQQYADSINLVRVKKLIVSGQYPGFHHFGIIASRYTIILCHITDYHEEDFEFIYNFMKQQVLNGDMTPEELKGFATRHYRNQGGKYGRPCNLFGVKSAYQKDVNELPLCDCANIDAIRKEIGMETLKVYYAEKHIPLPDCYGKRK